MQANHVKGKSVRMKTCIILSAAFLFIVASCKKSNENSLRYFEVGFNGNAADWRDSSFVVATADPQLIGQIIGQLAKPISERQIVIGELAAGSGGYNKNATHVFGWHFK